MNVSGLSVLTKSYAGLKVSSGGGKNAPVSRFVFPICVGCMLGTRAGAQVSTPVIQPVVIPVIDSPLNVRAK